MAESVAALSAQLVAIDAAIADAQTAQSIGSDSTSISRAQVASLYQQRRFVQRQLETAQAFAAGRSRMLSRGRIKGLGPFNESAQTW